MSITLRPLALAATALLALAACSTPANSDTPSPDAMASMAPAAPALSPANASTVMVQDFEFSPATLTVSAGTTVDFRFVGPSQHSATADDGAWDSGIQAPGADYTHMFSAPGTYAYHCTIHPTMKGTIVVR